LGTLRFPGPDSALPACPGRTPGTGIVAIIIDIEKHPEVSGMAAPTSRGGAERTGEGCPEETPEGYHAAGRGRPGHGSPQNAFFQAGAGAIEQCGISPLPLHAPGAPRSNAYMVRCMIREHHGTRTPDTREMDPGA